MWIDIGQTKLLLLKLKGLSSVVRNFIIFLFHGKSSYYMILTYYLFRLYQRNFITETLLKFYEEEDAPQKNVLSDKRSLKLDASPKRWKYFLFKITLNGMSYKK